jgi:hypothetical protein
MLRVDVYLTHCADPRYVPRMIEALETEDYLRRRLSPMQRRLLYQLAMGYNHGELARIHHVSVRTMLRRVTELREIVPVGRLCAPGWTHTVELAEKPKQVQKIRHVEKGRAWVGMRA